MNTRQLIIICIAATLVAGSLLFNGYANMKGPGVVVYLDKDAKQPAMLPLPETKAVTGERASFWWTVFLEAEKHQFTYAAVDTADKAVFNVYGNAK